MMTNDEKNALLKDLLDDATVEFVEDQAEPSPPPLGINVVETIKMKETLGGH
jgi:hypothetical protein